MDSIKPTLSPQFQRRAQTAQFIVDLEAYFHSHVVQEPRDRLFAVLPVPPEHLDRDAVDECRSIAAMLSMARKNKYALTWDAEAYSQDLKHVVLPNPHVEDRLVARYPPLIGVDTLQQFYDNHLPVLSEPAIVADINGHVLVWSLPGILSPERQRKMLSATRFLEAQLTMKPHDEDEPETKGWRTDDTFFNKGVEWKSGATLLYPAGFQGPQFVPAPSANSKSARAHDWMIAFEESGGLLDGILAVTHPDLYHSAQQLMTHLSTEHAPSQTMMQDWPSSFTAVQVIANRLTPWHRDLSSQAGWFDILVSLGSYGESAIVEIPSLSISLPYDSGSVVPMSSRLLVHGVPRVRSDRICYAFYMRKAVFEWAKVPFAGMATDDGPLPVYASALAPPIDNCITGFRSPEAAPKAVLDAGEEDAHSQGENPKTGGAEGAEGSDRAEGSDSGHSDIDTEDGRSSSEELTELEDDESDVDMQEGQSAA